MPGTRLVRVSVVVAVQILAHLRRARDVADRNYAEPYGVEAVLRDNSGNWLVLVEQKKPYTAEDFA